MSYQAALFLKILVGMEKLDHRERTAAFFLSAQCDDGGFRGRTSDSSGDLYYTAFALRGLLLLDAVNENVVQSAAGFLETQRNAIATAADLYSYTFCLSLLGGLAGIADHAEQRESLLRHWRRYRRGDACYASSENTSYSSTYTTFLAAGAFELLEAEQEMPVPEPISERQRPDGGFVELLPLRRSGTNPTAAAVALLKMLGREPSDRQGAIDFLLARQTPEGGFQANTLVSGADLLSSFTALVALVDLQAEHRCDVDSLRRYVTQLKCPDGGFRGAAWDDRSDVEYTFYGLALESLLTHSPCKTEGKKK